MIVSRHSGSSHSHSNARGRPAWPNRRRRCSFIAFRRSVPSAIGSAYSRQRQFRSATRVGRATRRDDSPGHATRSTPSRGERPAHLGGGRVRVGCRAGRPDSPKVMEPERIPPSMTRNAPATGRGPVGRASFQPERRAAPDHLQITLRGRPFGLSLRRHLPRPGGQDPLDPHLLRPDRTLHSARADAWGLIYVDALNPLSSPSRPLDQPGSIPLNLSSRSLDVRVYAQPPRRVAAAKRLTGDGRAVGVRADPSRVPGA